MSGRVGRPGLTMIAVVVMTALLVPGGAAPAFGQTGDGPATLSYEVDLNDRADDLFHVRMLVSDLGPDNAILQFASTAPGTYQVMDIGRYVADLGAFASDGTEVPVEVSYARTDIGDRVLTTAIVRDIAEQEKAVVVAICNKLESEIVELEDDERLEFLQEMGMEEPGLDRVIRAGYQLLKLHTYFTAGVKEVRAWTVRVGATAPEAAGVIHTDFQKGFIRAEVISYEDFIAYNGEQGAKDAGRWRLEGKDYVVQDGDVIHFRFNV